MKSLPIIPSVGIGKSAGTTLNICGILHCPIDRLVTIIPLEKIKPFVIPVILQISELDMGALCDSVDSLIKLISACESIKNVVICLQKEEGIVTYCVAAELRVFIENVTGNRSGALHAGGRWRAARFPTPLNEHYYYSG